VNNERRQRLIQSRMKGIYEEVSRLESRGQEQKSNESTEQA
jgi:hypothetical protein